MSVPPASEHTHGPFAGPYSSCPACRSVHIYGGIEHKQPGPFEGCLLCKVAALEARVEVELELRKAAYERIAALEARLAEATELCDDMFTSIENLAQIANLSGAVEEILTQFGYPLNHNLAHFAERRAALPPESAEG